MKIEPSGFGGLEITAENDAEGYWLFLFLKDFSKEAKEFFCSAHVGEIEIEINDGQSFSFEDYCNDNFNVENGVENADIIEKIYFHNV